MAFKLSKTQAAHWTALVDQARDRMIDANELIAELNGMLNERQSRLEAAIDGYNEAIGSLRSEAEEIINEWRAEFDGRGEGWQESDAGSTISDFISMWEGWEPQDAEIEFPEALEEIEEDTILDAEELPHAGEPN